MTDRPRSNRGGGMSKMAGRVGAAAIVLLLVVGASVTLRAPPTAAQDIDGATPEKVLAERYAPIIVVRAQSEPCDTSGEPFEPAPVEIVLTVRSLPLWAFNLVGSAIYLLLVPIGAAAVTYAYGTLASRSAAGLDPDRELIGVDHAG